MRVVLILLLAGLSLLSISLQRTYRHLSLKELKHRARQGSELAGMLHRAAAYGHSLRTVLWFLVGITNAAFFLTISLNTPAWFALVVSASLIWVGFVWLPARQATRYGELVAAKLAPVFAWLLQYIHPVLDFFISFIRRHTPVTIHTGLYDRSDLLDLLDRQQVQADNRIEQAELEVARHALTYGEKLVRDVMTPRRVVKRISVDEQIGPVLMSELHDSGHSRFPVYKVDKAKADTFVGILFLKDLINVKAGGKVSDHMRSNIVYLHEEQSLHDALQALLKTRQQLFITVNSFEEYVGIITAEDILEQIIGHPIVDEFDQYDDLRAVAARAAKTEHDAHQEIDASGDLKND